jgi:murein DD-endopeptidase MepM/ murein hydrolase activator NlpD
LILLVLPWLLILAPPAAADPRLPSPAGWPLIGSPRVLRAFDPPASAYGPGHRGVDLAASAGDAVQAAAAGTVRFAGQVAGRGVVTVDHGSFVTTYEPVRASVPAGQIVSVGTVLGRVSSGGHCGSRCLHWGLRRSETYLDPLLLIAGGNAGRLRLLAADQRSVVERLARQRVAAAAAARHAREPIKPGHESAVGPPGSHGFLHPVAGPITSAFGRRFHPVLRVWKLHDGTDFGARCGTPIRAPYAGTVAAAAYNAGYGNRLILRHGSVDGRRVQTAYNHATHFLVGSGRQVRRGQVIGYVGSTGLSTGCHLHLMVWLNGRLVDPMTWF